MRCVGQWMASNRLKVNPVPRLRPTGNGAFIISVIIDNYYHYQYQHQLNRNSGTTVQPSSTVRDLGVILDSEMSFSLLYINQLVSLCFYQLRCIKACIKALPTAVNSFVVSRIDYCNCLLAGAPQYQLNKLQAMMNSSGRLICGLNKIDHISRVLRNRLHWLPVEKRIQYKLCLLVCKAQCRLALLSVCVSCQWQKQTTVVHA